jgi:hypothetical protein
MSKRFDSPQAKAKRIVTHLTQVRLSLIPDSDPLAPQAGQTEPLRPERVRDAGARIAEHHLRVATMMALLERHGFHCRAGKNAVLCSSSEVEAGEAKRLLLAAGFQDREFQIVLEYARGWGML